jgi:regulation of enolase protein 1 (concanavalin A-like superfamily)
VRTRVKRASTDVGSHDCFKSVRRNISALITVLFVLFILHARADQILFTDDFNGKLGDGWSWIREHRDFWRESERGLEVRVEPGNEWGLANDAKNILVHPAPDATTSEVDVSVVFDSHPTNQYEQADLVWFYDESDMVKIGREMVDGKPSIVMGREEHDKARTVIIIPLVADSVQLRLAVKGNHIEGLYRESDDADWARAGECDLPKSGKVPAKVSLQFYNGPKDAQHWVRVTKFQVSKIINE